MSELPEGWEIVPLPDCVYFQEGPGLRKWQFGETGIPFLNIRTFNNGTIDKTKCQFVKIEDFTGKYEHFLLNEGDIVVSSSGTLGKLAVVREQDLPLMLNTSVIRYRTSYPEHLLQSYLKSYLQSQHFFRQIESAKTGSAIFNYGPSHLKQMKIVVAPPAEQRRIVAKLEKLLGKVEACQQRLAKVPVILKRFRQAVLAAACSGRLTESWRAKDFHSESSEASSLNSLQAEIQRKVIEAEGDYNEPPESWRWISLDALCIKITDGEHLTPPLSQTGIPLLSAKDVRENYLDFSDTKYVNTEVAAKSRSRCNPERGDILVVSRGATVGRTCRVQIDDVFCLMGSVLLFKPKAELVRPQIIEYCFKSPTGLMNLIARSGSTAQQAIYIRDMKSFPLPLPPKPEQQEIVRRVEAFFKLADQLEARYQTAKAQVDKLTGSILAKAFRGELVPTEAELARRECRDYESAAALLERINAAKTAKTERAGRTGQEPKASRPKRQPARKQPAETAPARNRKLFDE